MSISSFVIAALATFSASPLDSVHNMLGNSQKVIAVCESPSGFDTGNQHASFNEGAIMDVAAATVSDGSLKLVSGPDGYDILHETENGGLFWSARQSGVEVSNANLNAGSHHVVLNREQGPEHFLFILEIDGSGELLWSSATMSAMTRCNQYSF